MLCEEDCSYETRCLVSHPCVMVGRRRTVGFLQIVPGVFPTGGVTYRLRLAAVEWASRPLRQDGSINRPRHPRRPYPARLPRRMNSYSYETRCRKGRRKSRSDGWAAAGRGFPANCPSEAPGCTLTDYICKVLCGKKIVVFFPKDGRLIKYLPVCCRTAVTC